MQIPPFFPPIGLKPRKSTHRCPPLAPNTAWWKNLYTCQHNGGAISQQAHLILKLREKLVSCYFMDTDQVAQEHRLYLKFRFVVILAIVLFAALGCDKDGGSQPGGVSEITQRSAEPSPLPMAAIEKELDATVGQDPDRFLRRCRELIDSETSDEVRALVLKRRIAYHRVRGMAKDAAADCLMLLSGFPSALLEAAVRRDALDSMREAGLVLEAAILEALCAEEPPGDASGRVSCVAGLLASDLGIGLTGPDDVSAGTTTVSGLARAYWRLAPDLDEILASSTEDADSGDLFLFRARATALAIDQADLEDAVIAADEWVRETQAALEGVETTLCEKQALSFSALGVFRLLSRRVHATSFAGEWIEESYALMSSDLAVLLTRIGEIDLSLCVALGACNSSNDEFAFAAADRYHTFLTVTNNREERMRAYEYVVSRLPTSKETPQYMIEWASFCANVLGLNSKSEEILERVFTEFPDSDAADLAHIRHGLLLYEDGRYEDAYLSLQEVLVDSATNSEAVTAKFVTALCESAMGLDNESESHMYEIVEKHPTSLIAPRALFWLGSNALSSMEYETAEEIFRDLVSRFPDSQYAQKATGFVRRLSEMQDPGQAK